MNWGWLCAIGYFVIGTGVINAFGMLLVPPLARLWADRIIRKRLVPNPTPMVGGGKPYIFKPLFRGARFLGRESGKGEAKRISKRCWLVTDVIVLALGGFLFGCVGFPFIGFCLQARAIPGLLAFIACSLCGYSLVGQYFWSSIL